MKYEIEDTTLTFDVPASHLTDPQVVHAHALACMLAAGPDASSGCAEDTHARVLLSGLDTGVRVRIPWVYTCDAHGCTIATLATSDTSPEDEAISYVETGDYPGLAATHWIYLSTWGHYGPAEHTIAIEPCPPPCGSGKAPGPDDDDPHDWTDNDPRAGNDGGIEYLETCKRCGWQRLYESRGHDSLTGKSREKLTFIPPDVDHFDRYEDDYDGWPYNSRIEEV